MSDRLGTGGKAVPLLLVMSVVLMGVTALFSPAQAQLTRSGYPDVSKPHTDPTRKTFPYTDAGNRECLNVAREIGAESTNNRICSRDRDLNVYYFDHCDPASEARYFADKLDYDLGPWEWDYPFTGACYPPIRTECDIPQGESKPLNTASRLGSVCYQSCQFQDPTKRICVYNDDGSLKGCRADYISTGEYCDESDGASDRPFDDYTDAEGCYHDSGLNRYCATPAGDCPNEVVVDGVRYCRMPGEDDGDPDDPTDPGGPDDPEDPDDPEEPEEPEEPEVYCDENGGWNGSSYCNAGDDGHWGPGCGWHCGGDGGGGNDGDGDEDGDGDNGGDNGGGDNGGGNGGGGDSGGDGDGNGDGDGDQGDGDGDGGSDGIGSGTCNVDGQEAPECTDDQDGVQCAIVLHTWYLNCRDKLWKEDVAGTDEYLAGDSLLNDSEKNTVREQEIDISDRLSDLDDSGAGLGGSASCPSDLKVDLGRFGTLTIPMTFLCKLATTINPLVQALGWLVAALIVLERFSDN